MNWKDFFGHSFGYCICGLLGGLIGGLGVVYFTMGELPKTISTIRSAQNSIEHNVQSLMSSHENLSQSLAHWDRAEIGSLLKAIAILENDTQELSNDHKRIVDHILRFVASTAQIPEERTKHVQQTMQSLGYSVHFKPSLLNNNVYQIDLIQSEPTPRKLPNSNFEMNPNP